MIPAPGGHVDSRLEGGRGGGGGGVEGGWGGEGVGGEEGIGGEGVGREGAGVVRDCILCTSKGAGEDAQDRQGLYHEVQHPIE